jgi:hypothetical protein
VEAVANHHTPSRVEQRGLDVLTAVHVANILAHEQEDRAGASSLYEPLSEAYLASLGLQEQLPGWRAMAAERVAALRATE